MNPFSFVKIITGQNLLDRIQTNITNAFNSITGPFLGGVFLTGVSVGTGATVINHGLNRVPQLWVICDQNTNTNIKRLAWSATTITLEAGSSCVINLWVN